MSPYILAITAMLSMGLQPQEGTQDPPHELPKLPVKEASEASSHEVPWKEGLTIPVRVPIAAPGREYMTTISFPETRIETAISGWNTGDSATLTATAKGNLLFLRLAKPASGHIQILGGSGRHYLLAIEGIPELPSPVTRPADVYVRITLSESAKKAASSTKAESPSGTNPKPGGSPVIKLIRAMRLGKRLPGTRILRAGGEIALASKQVEIRLVFVYQLGQLTGRIYDVENLTDDKLAIDVTRLRIKDENSTLVASSLRKNVIHPTKTTRLYMVFWMDTPGPSNWGMKD